MADRRQPFIFRLWGGTRRTPDATVTRPPALQPITPQSNTSPTPPITNSAPVIKPTTESQAPPAKTTDNSPPKQTSQPTTSQIVEPKKTSPNETQTDHPLSNNTLTSRINEPKTPSKTAETKPPSSSRSPPHPLSPQPQPRSITSPSFTPQRASQPRSPSLLASRSPKQTTSNPPKDRQLGSPSIKPRTVAREASARTSASKEKDQKPAVPSQQEPQLKAKVKSDTVEETKLKHNEATEMLSRSTALGKTPETATPTETSDSSAVNGDQKSLEEPKPKPEDIKDVKEVAQETKVQANEETKKEASPSLNPKFGFEEPIPEDSKTPIKPDEAHTNNKTHQQTKKNSTIAHDKSTPEIERGKDGIPSFVPQLAMRDTKNSINDRNVSIITLAGENRGASMQMGAALKEGPLHIHRGYKVIKPDESSETSTDGEGSSGRKHPEGGKVAEDQPTEAYVNNNAQGINNSIVFNASIAERSPGVHMVVTHAPREPISPAEGINMMETRKAEFNMSRPEELTYEPTVRRRCLRGLLLETSDSDPEKPRRHGCRVGCEVKSKENGIDILGI